MRKETALSFGAPGAIRIIARGSSTERRAPADQRLRGAIMSAVAAAFEGDSATVDTKETMVSYPGTVCETNSNDTVFAETLVQSR